YRQLRVPPPRPGPPRPAEPHLDAHARGLAHRRRACLAPGRGDGDEESVKVPSPELVGVANVIATSHIVGLPTRLKMLRRSRDLFAVHVAEGDVDDYNVTEAGWYVGPFT